MDGGLLSLRWNDHGQTFFKMLSGVRKREAYCDVTLACDGRFYPVHKLVLSTCSDFFDQMFEKTACKHPVIVVANVAYKDLEALLNYMYLGEVNVLQTELPGLMKAAEALRIKGLAEPSKGLSSRDLRESKRSSSRDGDMPEIKRKRCEETASTSTRQNQSPVTERERTVYSRETQNSRVASNDSQTSRVNAQGPSSCGSNSSNSIDHPGASSSTDPVGHLAKQDLGASSQSDAENDPTDKALRPEVKMEEILVKEEPAGWFPETEEGLESLQFSEADTSLGYTHQPTSFRGGCLPWDLAAATTQAHVLDSQMSHGIPGPSRMQGVCQRDAHKGMPLLPTAHLYKSVVSVIQRQYKGGIIEQGGSNTSKDHGTENASLPGAMQGDGCFLEISQLYNLVTLNNASGCTIPEGRKDNVYFLIDNRDNVERRKAGKKSIYKDDCGAWSTKGSCNKHHYLLRNGHLAYLIKKSGLYCREIKNKPVPLDPQPREDDIVVVNKYHVFLRRKADYKRRISYFEKLPSGMADKTELAVVEYIGDFE